MEINKYDVFLLAADHGSLTAAAELLGYTQSGITRIIKGLEDEVGFPLFIRNKKGVTLTDNGEAMLPLFREIARSIQNAKELSADIRGTVKGSLCIGCYYSISATWLPTILRGFSELYPGVVVKLQECGNLEISKRLSDRSIDCSFGAQPIGDDFDWIPLFEDELVAWLPENHPMAKRGAFPAEDIEKEPFIYTSPGHDTEIDRLFAKLKIKPDVRFSTRDAYTTYNMVSAGLGMGLDQKLRSRGWSGNVKELSFFPKQYVPLGIAVPNLSEASPAAKRFIEYVRHVDLSKL